MNGLLRPRIWASFLASSGHAPCDVLSSTSRVRVPAVARLQAHLFRARSAQSRKRVPSFTVSRRQLKLPAERCRESSKCKEEIPFYCSSLASSVPLEKRDYGTALAGAFS